jgi:hypothetical protein
MPVRPVRDTRGLIVDFQIDGEFRASATTTTRPTTSPEAVSTMMNKIACIQLPRCHPRSRS